MRVERARIWAKAPTARGVTVDSAPPANITSASPRAMAAAASPSACPLVAQAEATLILGPRQSRSRLTCPASRFGAI